ncbi:unnamed protein product [Cyprideis torosa]|uniref:Uncharacterized protein n=1 Tax=Cyprideis torosa TaxID=163714 RepID=A0A7R8ZLB6_9CRUS|nr:unnamed protein product [Cyprideis torosa]CAG0886276.1 unnamed protein product [Cyprideis torosa]
MILWLCLCVPVTFFISAAQGAVKQPVLMTVEHRPLKRLPEQCGLKDAADCKRDGISNLYVNPTIWMNAKSFVESIVVASKNTVDLVVFPEYGLTGLGVLPPNKPQAQSEKWLIREDDEVIRLISDAARQNHNYVVVNLPEEVPCEDQTESADCPEEGFFAYNSDYVFDRSGSIIAKYRKTNLYLEPLFDLPPADQGLVTFETDFGIRFGLATCFDIMFQTPFVDLVHKAGVRHIIFPTAWIDNLPFYTSLAVMESRARGLGINLIGANLHFPPSGAIGSGIMGPQGAVAYTYRNSGQYAIGTLNEMGDATKGRVFGSAPPVPDDTQFTIGMNFSGMASEVLDLLSTGSSQVCQGPVCCSLKWALDQTILDDYGVFRLIAHDGRSNIGSGKFCWRYQICSLVRCASRNIDSCDEFTSTRSQSRNSPAFLPRTSLSGSFTTADIYPMAISGTGHLYSGAAVGGPERAKLDFRHETADRKATYSIATGSQIAVTSFGSMTLYGMVYDQDC